MQLTPRLVLMLATPPAMWATNAVVGRMAIGSIDPLVLGSVFGNCSGLDPDLHRRLLFGTHRP